MGSFHISREYGGWVTATITFILSLSYYMILNRFTALIIIFWIPVFLGLVLFDTRFPKFNSMEILILIVLMIFAIISLFYLYLFIIPYAFFSLSYFMRQYRKSNILVTLFGLVGQGSQLFFSVYFIHYNAFVVSVLIFIYLYGAEFGVRSFLRKNFYYSLYNIIPAIMGLLFDYPIFLISLLRVIYFKITGVKKIGILETFFYILVLIFIVFFKIL